MGVSHNKGESDEVSNTGEGAWATNNTIGNRVCFGGKFTDGGCAVCFV